MIQADGAEVRWDEQKKNWIVRIVVGEEVIRRPLAKAAHDTPDDSLRSTASKTAEDEGYTLATSAVKILR
jgi:hypothetical protein